MQDALKKLETQGVKLHPAIKIAFDKRPLPPAE
jgi:hypothetical protein